MRTNQFVVVKETSVQRGLLVVGRIKNIFSDAITVGVARLAACVILASVVALVWWQSGDPYLQMQVRTQKISEYFSNYLESGAPVYFGKRDAPQRLQNIMSAPFIGIIEPNLINEAVECIRRNKNDVVQVAQQFRYLDSSASSFKLPETIVLFPKEQDARRVFDLYGPALITPDFGSADSTGNLQRCVHAAYSKHRDERANKISEAKRDFYVNAVILAMKVLLLEIVGFAALLWVLKGFLRTQHK